MIPSSFPSAVRLTRKLQQLVRPQLKKEFQVSVPFTVELKTLQITPRAFALALNTSRLIYDGGLLDAQISSQQYLADSANLDLAATLDQRALRLGKLWIELEKHEALKDQIEGRLAVLDP